MSDTNETFLNSYKKAVPDIPHEVYLNTPVGEYDFNYVFPVKTLRSDKVELRPFTPSLHAKLFLEGTKADPDILRWLGGGPWSTLDELCGFVEKVWRLNPESLHYAVYTAPPGEEIGKTRPSDYTFAGVLGLINSVEAHQTSEPGWIVILKPFHRTHVLTHAAGLAMHRILDHPSEGGLGLRRCQWITTTLNIASQNAALRLGYQYEGVLRALWICPPGKEGARPGRKDVEKQGMVRDNWFASVTWEDWESGVKDHVDKLMVRK